MTLQSQFNTAEAGVAYRVTLDVHDNDPVAADNKRLFTSAFLR